ncbi:hypothetical protein TEA_007245 [Camellia sinensis var. sinensis]|uniref:Uncharacterized protein n=1 Tax=Camellia sinensis var. sinensis TaxID=542762 RepID=A0A4S4EHK0_CAMSN|nr:hypothetical protein TEA_007245 [Camellia sinensis var. sinensis]
MKAINKNRERMNALGVKNITTFLKAAVQHKKLRKEKQIPIEENDDDYRPSEAEDGSDTESYDSFEHERYHREPGEEYARNHPPKDVDPTMWIDLIDKKWNTKEFLEQSKANIANRERMYTKHSALLLDICPPRVVIFVDEGIFIGGLVIRGTTMRTSAPFHINLVV